MQKIVFCLVFVVATISFGGCNSRLPDDLPERYPCTVTILSKDGQPVKEACVMATNPESKWASIALTDEQGKAVLKTNGTYSGVPAGTYKIVVTKYDLIGRGEDVEPIEKLVFDQSFAAEDTTPLEMNVDAKKQNDVTFEVW